MSSTIRLLIIYAVVLVGMCVLGFLYNGNTLLLWFVLIPGVVLIGVAIVAAALFLLAWWSAQRLRCVAAATLISN